MSTTIKDDDLNKVSGGISDPNKYDEQKKETTCDNQFSYKCANCSYLNFSSEYLGNMPYYHLTCKLNKFNFWNLSVEEFRKFKNNK